MLRHVAHDQVTVFVALRKSREVTLRVFIGQAGPGRTLAFQGSAQTVELGTNLHVVAVTAQPLPSVARLVAETTYYYDLDFGPTQQTLGAAGVLETAAVTSPLGFAGADLPTFAYPPTDLAQVRLAHGSCRKAHGPSWDSLPIVAAMIEEAGPDASAPTFARGRPHQLLLTGDQIYADDVADTLLFMVTDAAATLLGWSETLPGNPAASALAPGARAPLTLAAGLTSGVSDPIYPKSHLVRFGEFCAMYLFAWSLTLWPPSTADLPPATMIYNGAPLPRSYVREFTHLTRFHETINTVRRVLANVPTYMVLDDHEVTDDWFMNRRWVAAPSQQQPPGGALASGMGRRIMANALAGYAVFQAWGSTPDRFDEGNVGEPGRELLAALGRWRGSDGPDREAIEQHVGLPPVLPATDNVLAKPARALSWFYRIAPRDASYEILVLDCRTEREYPPADNGDLLAAGLLSAAAVDAQITDQPNDARAITLVVAQTPVLGVPGVEKIQADSRGDDIWGRDVEAWGLNKPAFQRVISALARRRTRLIVLAGDVHYSFAARMTYRATRPFGVPAALPVRLDSVIGQLNSSSQHNEGDERMFLVLRGGSLRLHDGGYNQLYIKNMGERIRRDGWADPAEARWRTVIGSEVDVVNPLDWSSAPVVADPAWAPIGATLVNPPEWSYRIDCLHGRKPPSTTPVLPKLEEVPKARPEADAATARLHDRYRTDLRSDAGRDIVGVNNIGELRFGLAPDGTVRWAEQITWWRSETDATPTPLTRFTVQLTPDPP